MSMGVIWYNTGTKCLIRVAASMNSLRAVYGDEVPGALVMDGKEGWKEARQICKAFGMELVKHEFRTPEGSKRALINKTLLGEATPFESTVFLDADTIVVKKFDELWWLSEGENRPFVVPQFASWKTKGKIRKRIKAWAPLYPDKMEGALAFGPAINCGVFAWTRGCELSENWYRLAEPGRDLQRIPDETCLQVILQDYNHVVAEHWYNVSCKYDDGRDEQARIIHYHGNKHCRFVDGEPANHSDLWYPHFEQASKKVPCLKDLLRKDRMLRKYLTHWQRRKQDG